MWSTEDASPSFSGSHFAGAAQSAKVVTTADTERDVCQRSGPSRSMRTPSVIALPRRSESTGNTVNAGVESVCEQRSVVASACRRLGVSICVALCLPVLLFSLLLFGFVLLPLLPLIGACLVVWIGRSPSAPPARPNLPSAAAAAPALQYARAA